MTLEASEAIAVSARIHYIRTVLRGEVLSQLDTFSIEFGGTTTTHLNRVLCLGTYFLPINALPKQKRAMCRGMRKSRKLKVRRYTARINRDK